MLARAAPAAAPGDGSAPAPAWVQFHKDVAAGAWLLGATLHSVGVCDLAACFLRTAAGARHALCRPDPVPPPAPPPRTKWICRVLRPVLSGHAASFTPY